MAENTFLGLQPYTEDDAYRFKGRTEESQELFRLIVRNDFTVCYAESGEGKTSLLNAGVSPLLRENMYFPIAITFTSDDYQVTPDNFNTIIDRCIKDSIAEYNEKNKGVNVEYKLCSSDFQGLDCQEGLQQELSKYSWWKLRNYKPQAMGLTFTPVFVFDQFEEVFNMPGSIVWTKKFFDWLEDVSSDSCPEEIVKKIRAIIGTNAAFPTIKEEKDFKAVFSLRKEFIGELDYWGMQKCFIPSLKDNRYCLKALTYEGAKKVMTLQERFYENKVEQILTYFVGQYSREPEKTIKENLPVIPALLLSVICDSWEKDIDAFAEQSSTEIEQSMNTILERFFNQAIDAIAQELSEQDSNTNPAQYRYDLDTAVFAVVDSNGKRVRTKTTNASLTQIDFDAKYKQALSQHRIIKVTKIDGEDYVEIVHDSLCPIIAIRREARMAIEKEQLLREQAIKIRKRMSTCAILAIIVVAFLVLHRERTITLKEKEKIEAQKDSIDKQLQIIKTQDGIIKGFSSLFTICISIRSALEQNSIEGLKLANNALKDCKAKDRFKYLMCLSGNISLNGHFVYDEEFIDSIIAGKSVYEFAEQYAFNRGKRGHNYNKGTAFMVNKLVKKSSSSKYTFASRGHQKLAVITEPGGMVTLKIHVTNHNGLDVRFDDVKDVKKGQPYRISTFDLPYNISNKVELEVINCTNKDISFVILSN